VINSLRAWKHVALLAALVAVALLEPLALHVSEGVAIGVGVATLLVYVVVLLAVFENRWEQRMSLFLIGSAFLASILHQLVPHPSQIWAIVYHALAAVFLAFAVIVILQRIFWRRAIGTDDVVGALCGYLLAGAVWGNLYGLVYLIHPEAFQISDKIAAQLGNWHMQRFLFDYFSIMTLTTYGFSDIAPAGFPVYSLIWLESVFGQFYIAVVVAQLVGLSLAQAIKPDHPDVK
jgi:voltage-gated potassium channel